MRSALILALKGAFIWAPAVMFWASMVLEFDFRNDQELQDDEHEVRRLERFFDVEGLPEAEYLAEWDAKEQALSQIVDKLFRSQRFLEGLRPGGFPGHSSGMQLAAGSSEQADSMEVSYILPPTPWHGGNLATALQASPGPAPWSPRFVVNHGEGALALVSASFEYVQKGKDRDERWACTSLRSHLIAHSDGEHACEPLCDLRGPMPHGIRYMRL